MKRTKGLKRKYSIRSKSVLKRSGFAHSAGKKKLRKVQKKSLLKQKLWKLISEYVRRKEKGVCFTCGLTKHWKEMQAGHFIPKSLGLALYFEENNIHCQCFRCNINLGGNGAIYYQRMLEKYGQKEVDRIFLLKESVLKDLDYLTLIGRYEMKIEALSPSV